MSTKLSVEFMMGSVRMFNIISAMEERTGSKTNLLIQRVGAGERKCCVEGNAQQVMFAIGEIAAQGEGCLTLVRELSE
jgi:hypothetical protein